MKNKEKSNEHNDTSITKNYLIKSYALYTLMTCIGVYTQFISNSSIKEFIITDRGSWTLFMLNIFSDGVARGCFYLGLFGIILTIFIKIVMNFHRLFTMFSSIVLATYTFGLLIRLF